MGKAVCLVKEGKVVVIYPEGTRSRDGQLGAGKPGLGVIVAEASCPVLPVFIGGTHEVLPVGASWPRLRPITVVFGGPIDFSGDATRYPGKEFYRHVSRTVMARLDELARVVKPPDPPGDSRAGEVRN
jgi:1-acyl-sn-glycerol-3-phosphate acyltransferase